MIITIVSQLMAPSPAEREAAEMLPKTVEAHDEFLAGLQCMNAIETGGKAAVHHLQFPFNVAAWNLERCLFPSQSALSLAGQNVALALLSEMDSGMARTSQRHTTSEIAGELGMVWAYGVEFLELSLGSEHERAFCSDDHNQKGFHGNAIVSATLLERLFQIRLPGKRNWFLRDSDQPRIGERMAIGGVIQTVTGPLVTVSTHLESAGDAQLRAAQMREIIDEVESEFPGLPLLIGGDLNTGNHIGGNWRDETLFVEMAQRGFEVHGGAEDQTTTRPSLISRFPERAMKLDWFFTRGLRVTTSAICAAIDADGNPLSDHELLICTISGVLSDSSIESKVGLSG